ncbi:endoglucanase [Anaerosolibacter carboniphilus]|uniref:Endoglucanase n=1 Tax=Anaerosolibacter carboniphilus TaxID=1417629 RepID=A0A841KU71_9FIRM|nr:M42 family metallopeptidase [Anaerosolibacter carboniphilus]MBB6216947.1 endoglucanase [Anaerosolibacter carboniphilus]
MKLEQMLKDMVETPGISGFEHTISDVIQKHFDGLADDSKKDRLGNLVIYKKGMGPNSIKIMLAAHMDEIGLMVKKIDDKGFIQFTNIGGVDQRTLLTQEVMVHGTKGLFGVIGTKPPHILDPSDRVKAIKMEDMLIDVGLSKEEVDKFVRVGDSITIHRKMINLQNGLISAKALDDRAGVAVMYECLQILQKLRHQCDVYAVATVQEEVGTRGAIVSTYDILPDIGIAIDVTFGSTPDLSKDEAYEIGKGPTIGLGANIHPKIYERFIQVAKDHNIPYQIEILPGHSGTDAWAMQVTQSGVATGLLSIPLRYMHTSVETLDISDIKNTGKLLAYFIASLDEEDLEGFLCY